MVIEVKEPNGTPATKTVKVISQSIKVAPIATTKSVPVDQRTPKHYRRVSKIHSMSPGDSHGEDLPFPSSPRSPRSPRSPKAIEFPVDGKQTQGKRPERRRRKSISLHDRRDWMMKGTAFQISTFQSAELEPSPTPVSSKDGFELLCTYNWVSSKAPTVYVPGAPPVWTPVKLPTTLVKDSRINFIDQDAFHAPTYPFEPLFEAVSLMNPSVRFNDVDLVANRNSLRKLLNFAMGRAHESFRMDLHVVKNTLFITRREKSACEFIYGHQTSGFGHSFERAFTKSPPELEDSSSHHRAIRYSLGGLNCVVRFEVDTCCEENNNPEAPENGSVDAISRRNSDSSLVDSLAKVSTAESDPKPPKCHYTKIIRRGHVVPSSAMAEVKARSGRARLGELLPQLWFGRTPNLLVGTHDNGTFRKVEHTNAEAHFLDWENKNQKELRKLTRLIADIRDLTMKTKDKACVVVCNHNVRPLTLKVFTPMARKGVLPEKLINQFWDESTGA